ncbi:protease modulator HflC, partial [Escherichia coli]|uniref:protease modulator HflC n=1 Tax=Escherichia coli TaxID=562 RepID=UPI00200ED0FE
MRKSVIAIIIIVLVVLYMSVFVVKEGERGITLRFGKVLRDDDNKPLVYEPGLHFKIPFIETVKMLDARIQTMDNQADRFVTKEKKDLIVGRGMTKRKMAELLNDAHPEWSLRTCER